MSAETTCRRCSVVRVNTLCRLYDEGFREKNDRARTQLQALIRVAHGRGYRDGAKILMPALAPDHVRKISWNISSLLTDEDFIHHGVGIDGGKPKTG